MSAPAAELEAMAWRARVDEQIAAAETLVRLNPGWRLSRLVDSLYSHALVHDASGTRAFLYGAFWQGPDRPDETGDVPLFRKPASALKALGFTVAESRNQSKEGEG